LIEQIEHDLLPALLDSTSLGRALTIDRSRSP
jgi:hypothetical protein